MEMHGLHIFFQDLPLPLGKIALPLSLDVTIMHILLAVLLRFLMELQSWPERLGHLAKFLVTRQ